MNASPPSPWSRAFILLGLIVLGVAGTPFELPPGQVEGDWATALALSSFSPGSASGPAVWARVVPASDGTWTLEVHDEAGELRRSTGHAPPSSEDDRRALVVMARSMTRADAKLPPLLLPRVMRAPAPPTPPPREVSPTPPPEEAAAPTEPEPEAGPTLFREGHVHDVVVRDLPRTDPLYPTRTTNECFCRAYTQDPDGAYAIKTGFLLDPEQGCVCSGPALEQLEERLAPPPEDHRRRRY